MDTIVEDLPVPDLKVNLGGMRQIESRRVSEGHGVDYELICYWSPEDNKIYLAKITAEGETTIEIDPAEVMYHFEHPALIPFE